MSVVQHLCVLGLRQLVQAAPQALDFDGDDVLKMLADHFTDHSGRLKQASQNATERAGPALEIALAAASSMRVNRVEEFGELEGQGGGDAFDVHQAKGKSDGVMMMIHPL